MRKLTIRTVAILLLFLSHRAKGQNLIEPAPAVQYPRASFGFFTEYSANSSHILMGTARERSIVTGGIFIDEKLFSNNKLSFSYRAEVRPVMLIRQPILLGTDTVFEPPAPFPEIYYRNPYRTPLLNTHIKSLPTFRFKLVNGVWQIYYGTEYFDYGYRWSYAGGISPVGMELKGGNASSRIRPIFVGMGGVLMSPDDIPVDKTSWFNFSFEFGGGIELRKGNGRAMQIELRYHHISNKDLGHTNPGIDSAMIHIGYTFGGHRY